MKKFIEADIDKTGAYWRIQCDQSDLVKKPPDWKLQGLQETATGYGRRLNSGYSIHFRGRLRRIYVYCIPNTGTSYILGSGNWGKTNLLIDAF
jgi:hypothetical protein